MILLNEDTKCLVQGITGKQGSFHTEQMLKYNTNIVAGITPGKGGQKFLDRVPIFNSIEEAREFFKGDKFATNLGIQLDELTEDYCVCSLDIEENHKNAVGGVMGGVMFTLADFSFAVLSNHLHSLL